MRFSSAIKLDYQMEEIAASSIYWLGLASAPHRGEAVKRPYSTFNRTIGQTAWNTFFLNELSNA
jgi:hypothetical protein